MMKRQLRNWFIACTDSSFVAPECRCAIVYGEAVNVPGFPDGAKIQTSVVRRWTARTFRTESGSQYELVGDPAPEFVEKLNELECCKEFPEASKPELLKLLVAAPFAALAAEHRFFVQMYVSNDRSDDEHAICCARAGCMGQAKAGLFITIGGRGFWKKFCQKHYSEGTTPSALMNSGSKEK
jgi:hypothetical protein